MTMGKYKLTAKITNQTSKSDRYTKHFHCWKIELFIDRGFITDYQRSTREEARALARAFIKTGICPRD